MATTTTEPTPIEREEMLATALVHAAETCAEAAQEFKMARYFFDRDSLGKAAEAARIARQALDALERIGIEGGPVSEHATKVYAEAG